MHKFRKLTIDQQTLLVKKRGSYLSIRESNSFLINLYFIDDFFVELWYSSNGISVNQIRSFRKLKYLEPYLNTIDISDVVSSS
ncbi:hypothetical protein QQ008_16040 [Fulvivirgaceae bacterium BMA10]|uniref:Uncharacterized protein n=1 Tax=Splendidivirga corallicola TaxID=3051826 RepID=A0ABT8KQ64_9BACT|nr:hypothetical protein [Fulvivirgaceae bacterium BMA10]